MRTRKEIEDSWKGVPVKIKRINGDIDYEYRPSGSYIEGLTLEVLLDIRDLLTN